MTSNFDSIVCEISELKLQPLDNKAWLEQFAKFKDLVISLVEAAVESVAINCGPAPRVLGFIIDPNGKLAKFPRKAELEAWYALCRALETINERMRKLGLRERTYMPFRTFQKAVDDLIAGTLIIGTRATHGARTPSGQKSPSNSRPGE